MRRRDAHSSDQGHSPGDRVVDGTEPILSMPLLAANGNRLAYRGEVTGSAHESTGVKVAQKKGKQKVSLKLAKRKGKIWHNLLDDRQHATESSHIASKK